MRGVLVRTAVRVLDKAVRTFRRGNQAHTPSHLITGKAGEEEAYFYLRRHGYTVVARNWRSPRRRGEIDLVGWDGQVLCFVEVKTRSTRDVKPAEAAVDERKRRDIGAVAKEFLRRLPAKSGEERPVWRFDIVSVYCRPDGSPPEITLFKNAFSLP